MSFPTRVLTLLLAVAVLAAAPPESFQLTLTHLRGRVYVAVDAYPLSDENSAVYIGDRSVTVIGATFSPATAAGLAARIHAVTDKPIREVIDTNYNLDRAGGNEYFKSIGARIVSLGLTKDLLAKNWAQQIADARKRYPAYPDLKLVLPDVTHPANFELQGGRIQALYLGPSHTLDDIFIYFPEEKVLYGGCALKEQLGNLAQANLDDYSATLTKLKDLNLGYTTIIAGHWSPIHGPELVDQYLRLLDAARSAKR